MIGHTQVAIAAAVGITRQGVAARIKKLNARTSLARDAALARELRLVDGA